MAHLHGGEARTIMEEEDQRWMKDIQEAVAMAKETEVWSPTTTWTFDGCHECFFKKTDSGTYGSGYPICTLPGEKNPDPNEIVEALRTKVAPKGCKLHGGVAFRVKSPTT